MSSNATFPSLGGLPLTGGLPTKSQDFAASIVFTVAYALLLIPAFARIAQTSARCTVLIRPTVFLLIQTACFAIRAVIANGNYSTGIFITGQVLLLSGFVMLCEPVAVLLKDVVQLKQSSLPPEKRTLLVGAATICRVALFVALPLGIWAATLMKPNGSNPDENKVKTLKELNSALILLAIALTLLGFIYSVVEGLLSAANAAPLIFSCICILITAVYKLVTNFHPTNPFSVGTKVSFYCLLALLQWLAVIPLFAVNLKQRYILASSSKRKPDGDDAQAIGLA